MGAKSLRPLLASVLLWGSSSFIVAPHVAEDATAAAERGSSTRHHCAGKISPPIEIRIDDPASIEPGATFALTGSVEFKADAPLVTVRFESGGPLTTAAESIAAGPMFAGETLPFEIPVTCADYGKGLVHVWVEVTDELGEPWYAKRTTFYGLLQASGNRFGRGGFQALEIQEVEARLQRGLVGDEQAEQACLELRRMVPTMSAAPPEPVTFTPTEQRLNTLVGAPATGAIALAESAAPAGGSITVQGNVQWQDENGNFHPVWGARIEVRDDDLLIDEVVEVTITDQAGNYSAVVDNDDGIGQGDRDIYVRYRTRNAWVNTRTSGLLGDTYESDSGVSDETPDGSVIVESFAFAAGGNNDANSVFQAATWIAAYIAFDVEAAALSQVDIIWPNGEAGSFFDGAVQIEQADRYDWDTIHHEYGHYAMDELNIENNPGGPHSIGDCIVDEHGDDKSEGNRLAWGEGWPTFFGTTAQLELGLSSLNVPRVGDTLYQDLEDGSLTYNLESQDDNGRGEDNEVAVQRLLFDLYDANSDSRDAISRSDNSIWNAVKAAAGSPHILSTYWTGLRSGQGDSTQILMGEIATDHQIGPALDSPIEGAVVSPSNSSFSWQAEVGCPTSYGGNAFDLVFYDANTFAKLLTVPGLNMTSYNLSLAELQTLTATTHDVLWAVEGYHTPGPGTGPYLGESFAITINQPPEADAGPDDTAECTSPTTTPVQLDGTGSSDPDGDSLTYAWLAPGVAFDNPASATPIGQFSLGTTVATLTVSDGIDDDSDTVAITVEDTTPPTITCPDDIVVECSAAGGTPADDPQLVPFFAGVSAVDVCDVSPTIASDAPSFFLKGATVVEFTATDDANNASSCEATVTVVDTTPPEISVEVTPNALWPPNHKMWTITAAIEVEDICDPNPLVTLMSITSNEPDNGTGDGNTNNDIQDAAFGTDDRQFRLRAERKGNGNGRVYTIVYRATDMDGNFAEDTAEVRVPHDQSGMAKAAAGFTANGTALRPEAVTYDLVIPSRAGFDPTAIDTSDVYVGNHNGVQVPIGSRTVDLHDDGQPDLLLTYDAAFVRSLSGASNTAIGLHYQSASGTDYLVPNVFLLGVPVTLPDAAVPALPPADDMPEDRVGEGKVQFGM